MGWLRCAANLCNRTPRFNYNQPTRPLQNSRATCSRVGTIEHSKGLSMTGARRNPRRLPTTALDVARRAGISRSAVSRTFTEGASVAPATRKKVLAAARALKYRPNLFARSLKTRRSNILGLAVSGLDNQIYPDVVQRFSEEFSNAGYRVLLFITHGSAGPDPLVDELLKHRLDALILASSSVSSGLAEECRDAGVPVIMYNNVDPRSDVTSITATNALGSRTVAAFLAAAGHRRFGYIAGLRTDSSSYERDRAFSSYLRKHGLPEPLRAQGQFSFDGAIEATRTLLRLEQPPDALFCANDHMALAALQVARFEFGLIPGKDISIVGFDNAPIAAWPSFQLTTYSQPTARMVARTIELIRASLEHELPRGLHEQLPGELMVRSSARLPPTGVSVDSDGAQIWRPAMPL
jgi:DNA-binding LacI/PurR family transcriptional regulator